MTVVHLAASTQFGGPERQMLGLARALAPAVRTHVAAFSENGRCGPFLNEIARAGFGTTALHYDTPRLFAAANELAKLFRRIEASVVLCHGYKPNLVGRMAAARAGIPAVAVSRGWTWESPKVRVYEGIDRSHLRFLDHVVAVSEGQAAKVRRAGVPRHRLTVIRNACRLEAFAEPRPEARRALLAHFRTPPKFVVLAAGRLSPEKGFDVLVDAAAAVPDAGFVLYGEGSERDRLLQRIRALNLENRFALAGFTTGLDAVLPGADLFVLPSHTEGLPNVALEAAAAGVAVVATRVGGTPEAVAHGETGLLVPPAKPEALTAAMRVMLDDPARRAAFGAAGRARMEREFTFAAQAAAYRVLFASLTARRRAAA